MIVEDKGCIECGYALRPFRRNIGKNLGRRTLLGRGRCRLASDFRPALIHTCGKGGSPRVQTNGTTTSSGFDEYQSLCSARTHAIVPNSSAFDLHRWHPRAWCCAGTRDDECSRSEFSEF